MHNKNQRRHSPPSSSRAPLKSKMAVGRSEGEPAAFRVPRDYPHSRFTKAPLAVYPPKGGRPRACVSLPVVSLEKMPCFSQSEGTHVKVPSSPSMLGSTSSTPGSAPSTPSFSSVSSSPSSVKAHVSAASHKHPEKLLNGRGPVTPRSASPPLLSDRRSSPSRSPLDKWPAPSPSSQDRRLAASPSASLLDRRPTSSPSLSLLDRRPCVPPSPPERKHPDEVKVSRHRRVSGRIYDPNKHCGVLDPETKRPCTRSLTCKTHSLTHRRAVPGRTKDFDLLLAEHKGRAKEKEAGQKKEAVNSQSSQSAPPVNTTSGLLPSCHNGKATPTLKLRLASTHVHRGCGSGAVMLSSAPVPAPVSAPAPPSELMASWRRVGADARMSSDDGESELVDEMEKPWCHCSPRHPRPLAWCAFSSRVMGRSCYVFDRRWDRVRIALHCMVEKHISAQMWRKVPLGVESVVSVSQSLSELSPAPGHASTLDVLSAPLSHNGAGGSGHPPHTPKPKAARPPRVPGEGAAVRKRKLPPTCRKNGNAYHLPPDPVHISNGTVTLRGPTRPRGGCGLEPTPPADPGRPSSHGQTPCVSPDGRKRSTTASSVTADRPRKVTKTVLDGIFRKSGAGLLSSVVSHSALPW